MSHLINLAEMIYALISDKGNYVYWVINCLYILFINYKECLDLSHTQCIRPVSSEKKKNDCPLTGWNSVVHTHVILNHQFPSKTSLSLLTLTLKTQNYSAVPPPPQKCFRQLKRVESNSVACKAHMAVHTHNPELEGTGRKSTGFRKLIPTHKEASWSPASLGRDNAVQLTVPGDS